MTSEKPEASEALEQARAKALRLAKSFLRVFGQADRRSESQQIVMDHLSACAGNGEDGNAFRFDNAFDGIKTSLAAAHLDGAKSILRIINRQLRIATTPQKPEKAKPNVRRQTPQS